MRALVITAPGRAGVQEVPSPTPGPGEVVVDVGRAGICGTDIALFHGVMAYLRSGHARFPRRIGHGRTEMVASVGAGEVVVDVDRAGICGTDIEIFHGEMAYLRSGHARFPMRIGHEWTGIVASVGAGTDTGWIGRRVMGDTMLGCGSCRRCRRGNQ